MRGMKPGYVPLERALSKLGIASRSRARELISSAKVRVNGTLQVDPNFPVIPERVKIEIADQPVAKVQARTLMLYKPRGVVTTSSDEKGRPTVFSLIHEGDIHLVAVGRLDWATSGLLVLTNDTRLGARMTDPANRIRRTYLVTVRGEVTGEELAALQEGQVDAGDWLQAEEITIRKSSAKETHLTVQLTEGKNREIRRMFGAIGHEVTRLKRVAFGGLQLGTLKPGEYRELSDDDLRLIFVSASRL